MHKPTLKPIEQSADATPESTPVPDPFRPENLRLSQSFNEMVGVKKILTTIPVRKPGAQDFVRVRPGPEWRVILKLTRRCATIIFAHSSSLVFAKPLRRRSPVHKSSTGGQPVPPTLPVVTALGRFPRRPRACRRNRCECQSCHIS